MDSISHLIATNYLVDAEYLRICQLDQLGRACQLRGDIDRFVYYIAQAEEASRKWVKRLEIVP